MVTKKYQYASEEMEIAYNEIKNSNNNKGEYKKCLFHLHTPASHDYSLLSSLTTEKYRSLTDEEIMEIAKKEGLIPQNYKFKESQYRDYDSLKELLSYLLLTKSIIDNNIEIVVVTDHNNINGFYKLNKAIQIYKKNRKIKIIPSLVLGIEISCADKFHIVGIFPDDLNRKKRIKENITQWIDDNIMDEQSGTFLTSLQVIEFIKSLNGISYIAHFDTSDVFKDSKFLSGAYRKKLFNSNELNIIGLSNLETKDKINEKIKTYTKKSFDYVLDNDSHNINDVNNNIFWIKGEKCNFKMIESALKDYRISIDCRKPKQPQGFIQGIYINGGNEGFIVGKNSNKMILTFSDSLNCFIGGRGSGKSTILKIIEFVLKQNEIKVSDLEFICKHKSIWILYSNNNKEYFIRFYPPEKKYKDEDIISYFEKYPHKYYMKQTYNQIIIDEENKDIALEKYIELFELKTNEEKLKFTKFNLNDKKEKLNSFFKKGYSINKLVEKSDSEEIERYIYKTMFKNVILKSDTKLSSISSIAGLKNVLKEIEDIKYNRKYEVESVINSFNESQKNILRIVYEQKENKNKILKINELLKIYEENLDNYYKRDGILYNIKNVSVIDYLEELIFTLGITKFLKLFLEKKYQEILNCLDILKYTEIQNTKMIDNEVKEINNINKINFIEVIGKHLLTKTNEKIIIKSLNIYIKKIDTFNLEFNINSKEQTTTAPILFKNIKYLSLGQKVVALITFILAYSEYSKDYTPLIIDQPEDNLDNQYIYKNLVKQLKDAKSKRQVIIATHNATIVTNAKADEVIVMNSDNQHAWVEDTGYPTEDIIKKHIINYLEGGIESFRHKCFVYSDIINTK